MFKLGGHRPDPINKNYQSFNTEMIKSTSIITEADLRSFSSPRHNQAHTGTCVAQSVIKALEIKRIQKHGLASHVPLSVMDLYYGARDLMEPKETDIDNGTHIYLACEVLKKFGVCREIMNPFNDADLFKPTSIMATRESYMNKIKTSYKITSTGEDRINDVIINLKAGNPVVFGTLVGDTWFNYTSSSTPLGITKFENSKGGHATCLVGYVDGKFITENSWGESWGDNGYGWLQPEVISYNNSSDFWVIIDGSELNFESVK
jgi:C1A family cysteine protease